MRFGLLLGFLLLPATALAVDFFGPIVPPCTEYGLGSGVCQACNLAQLASRLMRAFVALAVMGSVLMLAYAGFLYVTAASNSSNLQSARSVFSNVFLGLIIVLVAWLIIDITLRTFTNQSLNVLTTFQCVQVKFTSGQFTFPTTPENNDDVAVVPASSDYCSDSQLPGFESMIGNAIDKYGANLLSSNISGIELYCPNFVRMSNAERKAFWIRYMSTVAKYESSCNPSGNPFPEPTLGKDSVTGLPVVSEGLFQLSYGSERGRARSAGDGTCYFDPAKQDIRDAVKNTNCAIFILNQDLGSSGSVNGATRYWSVSRTKRAQLIAATRDVKGCR